LTADTGYSVEVAGQNSQFEGTKSTAVTMTTSAAGAEGDLSVLKALPTAEGSGALSVGGRGGTVWYVTNLNDSGTGSLRAACEASGPRIVIFRVAGTIVLDSTIQIANPYITIAGQTAPGGGIQIAGKETGEYTPDVAGSNAYFYLIRTTTHDVVIQYLRLRMGYRGNDSVGRTSVVMISPGSEKVVLDHCSIFWCQDENITVWSNGTPVVTNITVQNCIVAEAFDNYGGGTHSCNLGLGGSTAAYNEASTDWDFHHNYIGTSSHRNPLASNKSLRWINNVVYNWGFYASSWGPGVTVDAIGNFYRTGPKVVNSTRRAELLAYRQTDTCTKSQWMTGPHSFYVSGNLGPYHGLDDNYNMLKQQNCENGSIIGTLEAEYRRASPMAPVGVAITVEDVSTLAANMMAHVGASRRLDDNGQLVDNRDAADTRVVADFNNGTGPTVIRHETDVGGFPTIASGTAYTSTAGDGISDGWKTANGLNTATSYAATAVPGLVGWTYMDLFLAGRNIP